jgi:hypothetical protein
MGSRALESVAPSKQSLVELIYKGHKCVLKLDSHHNARGSISFDMLLAIVSLLTSF